MEQQTLSVAKAGLVCKLQTRCSIIAACNSKGRFEEGELLSANVALASPLLSRFDLIIVMADRKSADWDRSLSTSILEASSKSGTRRKQTERTSVDFETLKAYVNFVRNEMRPTMSHGARVVLGKYYQLQRRADLRDVARTTIRLLESLIRLAQAHAKLMCRESVEISDAIWSIVLMETSLATQSVLGMRPDVYAVSAESPTVQYEQYETTILTKLEINLKIIDNSHLKLDAEADEILCSWKATQ
jgi:DNA helicase MCM9